MAHAVNKRRKEQQDLLGFIPPSVTTNEWGLTDMQENFVQHYVREANAALAARLAGYSTFVARETGYAMLRVPHIMSRVQQLRTKTDKGHDGLREKIINKLMVMADLDIASIYNKDGSMKSVHEWDLEARTSIIGIDTTHDVAGFNATKKVKLSERTKALDMLIKMQGYNAPEKHSPTDPDGNYVQPVFNINIIPPEKELG